MARVDRNTMNEAASVDVLVVGAGPTGLMLAASLHSFGVRTRIVDRLIDRAHESRALVVHARSLEILRDLGVAEILRRRGNTSTRSYPPEREEEIRDSFRRHRRYRHRVPVHPFHLTGRNRRGAERAPCLSWAARRTRCRSNGAGTRRRRSCLHPPP